MSANRDLPSVLDILNAAQHIQQSMTGVTRDQLDVNGEKQAAVLYRLIVIGEATKRISIEFRNQHPDIPWKDMAGMRDRVTHGYDRVDLDIVWDVVQFRIPELIHLLQPLLPND
jgi:uncharacterized protein with HEPN domain